MKNPHHSERNNIILKAIIEDFTFKGRPVSSISLAEMFDLSPASIRHVMQELEQTEYITQPHPSAGRVPTDKGYRVYIDSLMEEEPLPEGEKDNIVQEYEQSSELEEMMQNTTRLLSAFSRYVGVNLLPQREKVYLEGFSNLLEQPDFDDIGLVRKIFRIYEDKELLSEILKEHLKDEKISVTIGAENQHQEFYECSLITASYKIEDEPAGAIGVIGPKRMFYPHVISVVRFIADTIGKFLTIRR
ncbi:MAG: hypothetical protein QME42_05790 [bacterium]|nr:hypothetical protein [bacterium]